MPETRGNAEKTKWWYAGDSISKVAQNTYLVKVSEIEFPWHFAGVLHRPTLSAILKQVVPPSYGSPYALRCPQIALYALLQFSPRCFSPNSKKGCKRILHVLRRYTLSRCITGVSNTIQGAELPVQFPVKKRRWGAKNQCRLQWTGRCIWQCGCNAASQERKYRISGKIPPPPPTICTPLFKVAQNSESCTKFFALFYTICKLQKTLLFRGIPLPVFIHPVPLAGGFALFIRPCLWHKKWTCCSMSGIVCITLMRCNHPLPYPAQKNTTIGWMVVRFV